MLKRMQRGRRGPVLSEAGATLVEFALLFPVFMTLVLGMITGGIAYNQKLTMTAAAREASRYAATLPVTPACGSTGEGSPSKDLKEWLNCVASVAVQTSAEELPNTAPGRSICVAYVKPLSVGAAVDNDETRRLVLTIANTGVSSENGKRCDGASSSSISHRHVQVVMTRDSEIQALFFSIPVKLTATSVTRFER